MLKVAANAVAHAPGGAMTGLIGYLKAWQEMNADLELTVYVSRQVVYDTVRVIRPDIRLVKFAWGMPSYKHFLMQQFALGKQICNDGADVVWATNFLVGRCPVPQLVHHRNLKRFLVGSIWPQLREANFSEAVKDHFARKALLKSAFNIFISHYIRQEAERFVPESAPKNHVIYNGLSSDILRATEIAEDIWQGQPHLFALQSPSRHKDNPTLLRALAQLRELVPQVPWRLTIGGGGDWGEMKRLAAELKIDQYVAFPGHLWPEQSAPILRTSLCLVCPSRLESFGNPPLEAMAHSCPVVASDCTAISEVVDQAGLLVPPGQPDAFAQAILRIYQDGELRRTLIARGLQRVKQFSWNNAAREMADLLHRSAAAG